MDQNSSSGLTQLERYTNNLAASVKVLSDQMRDAGLQSSPGAQTASIWSASHLAIPPDAPYEVHHARRSVLTNITKLQTLLMGPDDLIQNLASQVRI